MMLGGCAEPGPRILDAFGRSGQPLLLPGGSRPVYRVGDLVLKRLSRGALEHNRSWELFPWLAGVLDTLPHAGFRVARPVRTRDGAWMTDDGWTASAYLVGRHATADDVPACIVAIQALHAALAEAPKHPLLDRNESIFGRADRACWGARPAGVPTQVAPLVDALYAIRQPIDALDEQVIHGDLNPENVLVAPGLPPAFLDVAPFWRPPGFALAMFANWIGPRRGDVSVLRYFAGQPHFDQLLIRAAIRMLLVMTDDLENFEGSWEARAAWLVLHLERDSHRGRPRT
ncbi:MAG: phosphotransferase [Chloroflexi bacterium]|nr:phosphotransferase [Chloroflexota bacterium]